MTPPSPGLGRGLGALIPSTGQSQPAAETLGAVIMAPVQDIIPNPRQPRSTISPETLAELAASIREHGVIQPLIVTRAAPDAGALYQLVAGERRWRAAQLAGLSQIPVLLKETTPEQQLELALVENLQRADLNPLEEAEAYQALIADFGLSQQEVAGRVGKSRVAVANAVRLLRLPAPVKTLLIEGGLTEGHARALLTLADDEAIVRAAEQVVARDLTVRQTEELARRLASAAAHPDPDETEADTASDADRRHTRQLEEAFRSALGTKVALTRGRRGGRLIISFYSDEELQAIYEHIVGMGDQ